MTSSGWILGLLGAAACGRFAFDPNGTQDDSAVGALCPSALPAEWIFCDDFENGTLLEHYPEVSSFGPPRIVSTEAVSGSRSLELSWATGDNEPGWIWIWFGRTPLGRYIRPDDDVEDVYVRMRVKAESSWTWNGNAVGFLRVTSFAAADWSQAMVGSLTSTDGTLQSHGWSCVQSGVVTCQGFGDTTALQLLQEGSSTTPVVADRWQCVELHVRLNTAGAQDGIFEIGIDGVPQVQMTDLDWRGTWTTYGINGINFYGWWESIGSTIATRRWIDDIVIATVPVRC